MKMRSLTVILGALAAAALGACTVESTTGSTGTGGATTTTTTTGATTTSTTGGTGGSGGDASTTSSTGSAMCNPDYTCVEAIAQGSGDPAELCDGMALDEFNALAACTCSGNCAATCADNACKQQDPSAECKACLSTPDTGCGKEFNACVNGT